MSLIERSFHNNNESNQIIIIIIIMIFVFLSYGVDKLKSSCLLNQNETNKKTLAFMVRILFFIGKNNNNNNKRISLYGQHIKWWWWWWWPHINIILTWINDGIIIIISNVQADRTKLKKNNEINEWSNYFFRTMNNMAMKNPPNDMNGKKVRKQHSMLNP